MSVLIPSFLRALVSLAMEMLLMFSLLQPKYGKKVNILTIAGYLAVNLLIALFCYVSGNLTLLARLELIILAIMCFAIRPLFRDSFMQWMFSFLTLEIVIMCVVVLSFSISHRMPYPMYANVLLRLILYSGIIFLQYRYIRPLYHQMVTHWNVFFCVAAAIFAAFAYYFTAGEDIVKNLTEQAVPIHLLVVITVAAYVSIFYSLKTISREYALREENLRMQSNQELLHLSVTTMANRIGLLDEAQQQSRIADHDRRHFNNTLLELLERQKTEEAIAFLRQQSGTQPFRVRNYCENTVINAAVCYYAGLAKEKGITTEISLDIPQSLPVDSMELAMVISNLLENAIQACEALGNDRSRIIRFTCRQVGRLILEISNSCDASVRLDENGYPFAKESGHGVGTKSVLAFAQGNDAELLYQITDGTFRVRMLI
jgi:signal transduction histidine kinase